MTLRRRRAAQERNDAQQSLKLAEGQNKKLFQIALQYRSANDKLKKQLTDVSNMLAAVVAFCGEKGELKIPHKALELLPSDAVLIEEYEPANDLTILKVGRRPAPPPFVPPGEAAPEGEKTLAQKIYDGDVDPIVDNPTPEVQNEGLLDDEAIDNNQDTERA